MKMFIAVVILVVALAGAEAGHRHNREMVSENNNTPKKWLKGNGIRTDVCDECQMIIKRIGEIGRDPQKLAELKLLLSVLCHETSYEQECKLFVSRLNIFIEKLLPYLKDPAKVCKDLHICGNKRIERHRAIAQLYASMLYPRNAVQGVKDVVCEECQFAAHELDQLIQDKEYQQEVHDWVHNEICAHLGRYAGTCDLLLDDFLPEFFTELHNVLQDNRQFCVDLELCEPEHRARPAGSNYNRIDDSSSSSDESSEEPQQRRRSHQMIAVLLK